jgi:hypothetical protein
MDGTQVGANISSTENFTDDATAFRISNYENPIGRVDEFRVSVGTDRGWSADFTPPAAPYSVPFVITAAPTLSMENTGLSSAVATITAAGTSTDNSVYSQPFASSTWSDHGSLSGNGTLAFSISPGAYWFKAQSVAETSANVSNVTYLTVTGTSTPIQGQILEAVRNNITAAGLIGGNGSAVEAKVAWPPEWGTWSACQAFVMPDSEEIEPNMTGVDTLNIGINVVLCELTSQAAGSADLMRQMDLRKSVTNLFVGKRLTSLNEVWCQNLTDSRFFNDQALLDYQGIYPLTFRFQTRVRRT